MPVIGTFSATPDGYAGTIKTMTLAARVRFVANAHEEADNAPDYRVLAGSTEVGVAWRKTKQGTDQTYLRVKLDDPALPEPIWGALLEMSEDGIVRLVWSRDRQG